MTPADEFMRALHHLAKNTSTYAINPDDNEEYIIDDSVAIEMHPLVESPNYIHFVSIRALNPSNGHGSRAMRKVLKLADGNEIIMIGRVMPYHTENISKEKLRQWYRKMGCHPVDPKNEDGFWVRGPGGTKVKIKLGWRSNYKVFNGLSEEENNERLIFISLAIGIVLIFLYKMKG